MNMLMNMLKIGFCKCEFCEKLVIRNINFMKNEILEM